MSDPRRVPRVSTCSSSGGGGGPVVVTGTVDIGNTVDVTGTVGIDGPVDVTGTVGIDGPITLTTANATGDAFGRLRVSNPFTLFEFNSIIGKGSNTFGTPIIDEVVTGSATSTHVTNESYIRMQVTGIGDSVVRQSHEYILYQPGKSKLVFMTGVLHTATSPGVETRIGCFDANMGVFIEYSSGVYRVVLRNGGTDTSVASRSAWSIDPLNGTGPSGVSVDFSKAQIFMFDFEWLGVGQVRCGVVFEGQVYYYHIFTHANALGAPYTLTAKLPLRYQITSTGGAGEMRMICGTVISEGGVSTPGVRFVAPKNPTTALTTWNITNAAFRPIMSIRINTAYPYRVGTIKIRNIDLFATDQNDLFTWCIVRNATLTGGTFNDHDPAASIAQVCIHGSGNTYSAGTGTVLYQNFSSARTNTIFFSSIEELLAAPSACVGLDGTSDTLTILAREISTSSSVTLYGVLEWIELV